MTRWRIIEPPKKPPDAKKVFTGVLFDIYQWQQKMFDGSETTFEMLKRTPTIDIIALVDDKIIILQQEQPARPPFVSLPGGKIDEGEIALETAKRELLEETGYTSDNITLLQEFSGGSKIYYHEHLFIAKDCKKLGDQQLDPGEKIEVGLYSFDDFLQFCRVDGFTAPLGFRFMMYEALVDADKKAELKNKIY